MQTAVAAKDMLRHISETERGERARRAAAGALVLRVVELAVSEAPDEFTVRRAQAEVAGLEKSAESGPGVQPRARSCCARWSWP